MKTALAEGIPFVLGQPLEGGFFSHVYLHGAQRRALIIAPKAEGEIAEARWNKSYGMVEGALSYVDGLANTEAMAAVGSELAKKIRALRIGGHEDWCLPALDQLEPAYRLLKPGSEKNYCWSRSGINLSSIPPSWPYTPESPVQTEVEIFRAGGAEAFEEAYYWTSTQNASNSAYAWFQSFSDGNQLCIGKDDRYMARAVRSIPI